MLYEECLLKMSSSQYETAPIMWVAQWGPCRSLESTIDRSDGAGVRWPPLAHIPAPTVVAFRLAGGIIYGPVFFIGEWWSIIRCRPRKLKRALGSS